MSDTKAGTVAKTATGLVKVYCDGCQKERATIREVLKCFKCGTTMRYMLSPLGQCGVRA